MRGTGRGGSDRNESAYLDGMRRIIINGVIVIPGNVIAGMSRENRRRGVVSWRSGRQ